MDQERHQREIEAITLQAPSALASGETAIDGRGYADGGKISVDQAIRV